ncbi:MAG: LacI family DNA-binding transcriptional regulator [Mangrovibacterium sp.]
MIRPIKPVKRIRIKDIALKAGVSIGTVDRVIHNRGEVSPETKSRILRILEEMDYRPNMLASALALKRMHAFAILIPEPQSEEAYWNKPLKGIKKAFSELQEYGVQITIYRFLQTDPDSFRDRAEEIIRSAPEGVVLAPFFSRESRTLIEKLEAQGIPYVFIDSNLKEFHTVSYIGQNSFQSGALSAKLLDFSLPGTANILVTHFAKERDNQNHLVQREKGFYAYFEENDPGKHKLLRTFEITDPGSEMLFRLLDEQFSKIQPVQGIFVTNSQVYRMAAYLASRNLSHVRLIGHDLIRQNIEWLREGVVDFLICQRPEEQGYRAIENLFQYVVLKKHVPAENYTSIDIITKENLDFYREFNLINYGTN